MKNLLIALTGVTLGVVGVSAQIIPTSPATLWTPVHYAGTTATPEPAGDQQGNSRGDIVGNAGSPSFYSRHWHDWTSSMAGAQVAFRLRLAGDQGREGFDRAAFVGLEVTGDSSLDLFLGVNNQGARNELGIWWPETGRDNTSPNTTRIGDRVRAYAITPANYNWGPVNAAIDPLALNYDIDGGGRTDHFLTFLFPLQDVADVFATRGISFDLTTTVRAVAATSTQGNTINQDWNGIEGGNNSTQPWTELWGLNSVVLIPEPTSATIVLLGLGIWICASRRRKHA